MHEPEGGDGVSTAVAEFVMHSPSRRARRGETNEGQFCSRSRAAVGRARVLLSIDFGAVAGGVKDFAGAGRIPAVTPRALLAELGAKIAGLREKDKSLLAQLIAYEKAGVRSQEPKPGPNPRQAGGKNDCR